jgi:hypothetical protein
LSQYQYLVDRYTQSLTKYDVQELFDRLKEVKGNLTAATREVEIQRKTVYDWENNSEDIKTATKRKILEASLNNDLYGTLDFLVRKNALNYREILERYISVNSDRMLSTNDPQEFQRIITSFEKSITSHSGAIHDMKTIPIEEIIDSINQKACSLGVEGAAKDINLIGPQRLSQKFINLLETFNMKTMFKGEIAEKLGLPKEFVERACKAISYIDPSTGNYEEPIRSDKHEAKRLIGQKVGLDTLSHGYIYARKE